MVQWEKVQVIFQFVARMKMTTISKKWGPYLSAAVWNQRLMISSANWEKRKTQGTRPSEEEVILEWK